MAVRDARGRFVKGGGARGEVRDIDKGHKALMNRLLHRAGDLTVGIHAAEGAVPKKGGADDADSEEGLTVVEVGTFHEFGLGVPRRSFIADWEDENEAKHKAQLRQMAQAVVTGKVESVEQGLARLGTLYQAEVQKRISDGIEPPLAESTIRRKGSSKPLIDTGQLRSSITHVAKAK